MEAGSSTRGAGRSLDVRRDFSLPPGSISARLTQEEVAERGPQHSLSHQWCLRPGESRDVPGEAP